jgi:uncharacterized membrane protein YhaH (DUF805 family)
MSYHDKKLTPLEILFSFEGRIARLDYWLYSLIPFGIMTLGILILLPIDGKNRYAYNPSILTLLVFLIIWGIGIWISLAVQAKRWHDIDRSAWWILLNIIPYAGIIVFFILGFLPGTVGPNRFGPDPLESERKRGMRAVSPNLAAPVVPPVQPPPSPDPRSVTLLGRGHSTPPIVLDPGVEITVGRSRQATVVLNDRFISSLHLALRLNERGEVTVQDLGSTNGTFLQGKRLVPNQTYILHPGEALEIGSKNIVYTL